MIDIDACRALFGQMLRNAQALESILRASGITVSEEDTRVYAERLQQISALTIEQAATLQTMKLALGIKEPPPDRRSGLDRRWRR